MRAPWNLKAVIASLLLAGCAGIVVPPSAGEKLKLAEHGVSDDTNVIVLVETEEAANRLMINASRGDYQLVGKRRLTGLNLILLDFRRPKGISSTLAVADMKRMEPSATAGVDSLYKIQQAAAQPVDPRQYASAMIEWPQNGCPAQVSLGMIDNGVDMSAPMLASAKITSRDFASDSDAGSHGTAIASLLVGDGRLVDAHLYSANVVGGGEPGAGVFEVVAALNWMQEMDIPLVNVSLAGPHNPVLEKAIKQATSRGMVIVAAVGNDGPSAAPLYPAAFEDVIAVTAVDSALDVYDQAVRGRHIDFAAPGVDVFVEGGGYLSGTSIAAPFVTSLIASDQTLAQQNRSELIRETVANNTVDLGAAGHDPVFGAGLIRQSQSCDLNP